MVNWDEIKKELKKLTPERALEYLEYILKTVKDKEILEEIKKEIENIKKVIQETKTWKKQGEITPISRDVLDSLQDMARERPQRREMNLEKAVDLISKDLNVKEEQKGVDYNKGGTDYGNYLIEKIDTGYEKPNSTFNPDKLIERPELRQIELIKQQRRGGYPEDKKEKREEFKYQTITTEYKRKKDDVR